jgi:hypothetical protein
MYRLDLNKLQTVVWSIFARDSLACREPRLGLLLLVYDNLEHIEN